MTATNRPSSSPRGERMGVRYAYIGHLQFLITFLSSHYKNPQTAEWLPLGTEFFIGTSGAYTQLSKVDLFLLPFSGDAFPADLHVEGNGAELLAEARRAPSVRCTGPGFPLPARVLKRFRECTRSLTLAAQ